MQANKSMFIVPFANIGRMSGDPHDQVNLLSLNTESNSTGFSFQPDRSKQIAYSTWCQKLEKAHACLNTVQK